MAPNGMKEQAGTIERARSLWSRLWYEFRLAGEMQPSLRSVSLYINAERNGNTFRQTPNHGIYESLPLILQVRLSENQDEASRGIANVTCPNLEALRARFGTRPLESRHQEKLLKSLTKRVENGAAIPNDLNLDTAQELLRPMEMPRVP